MKKLTLYTFLPLFLVMAILSCDTTKDVEKPSVSVSSDKDSSKKGEQVPDVTADRMLVVELEGMVCKMGCGGEIRKELYATNGVENVSFDFDEENPLDVAHVAYDRDKISADEIISTINAINDGQFKVKDTHSEPYVSPSVSVHESTEKSGSTKKARVQVKSPKYTSAPDVFDIFSFLF